MGEMVFPAVFKDFSQCVHMFFYFSLIEFTPLTNLFQPTTEFIFPQIFLFIHSLIVIIHIVAD